MKTSTTIREMMVAGNRILVPAYQRAYSWETERTKENSAKHVNVFLRDLEEYLASPAQTPYYFGHFLFEEMKEEYNVIDGQQRLTTLVIFLAALFTRLKSLRDLTETERERYEDLIKRNSTYRFETVEYDRQFFKDYVIHQVRRDKNTLKTTSAKRIVAAFEFFTASLADKGEDYLTRMLDAVCAASCTTHPVRNESEAIQMFIFQNNRGKKPSNLETLKAQFMFAVHLHGGAEKDDLIETIKSRFRTIYEAISAIEGHIREDDVLVYTQQVFFDSLWEGGSLDRIGKLLAAGQPLTFIQDFTLALETSFQHLTTFLRDDERDHLAIHSLVALGGLRLALPFIIKAYSFEVPIGEICRLCAALETLVLRGRIIGTRADLTSRLSDVYGDFSPANNSIDPIIRQVNRLKDSTDWWFAHWNKVELRKALQGRLHPAVARFLLWKYENHLLAQGKAGYAPMRFDFIMRPHLEHIAPQTPARGEQLATGYPPYDEAFRNECIDCLGNYLLLSAPHNSSIGNRPFLTKRASYHHLAQQREVQELSAPDGVWTRLLIEKRKGKIVDFITESL